jgi:acetolactate synthase-1/2/3 large subunit
VLLASAARPVVVGGTGVRWSGAGAALGRFAEAIDAPLYLNALGRGTVDPEHPRLFTTTRRMAMERADLIAIVGTPIDFRLSYGRPPLFPPDARVIQIDEEPTAIAFNRAVDVGLVADTRSALDALTAALSGRAIRHDAWLGRLREAERDRAEATARLLTSDTVPIHPLRIFGELAQLLPPETIVVGDGGDIVTWASDALPISPEGAWLDPGRFGCLGVGPGFAIAAKVARPDAPVVLVMGDGAFGLSGFDLETAARMKLPMLVIVGNNGGWDHLHGDVRYDRIVEAFGGGGERVEHPADLRAALERGLAFDRPYCLSIPLDETLRYAKSSPISGLTPARTWGGTY